MAAAAAFPALWIVFVVPPPALPPYVTIDRVEPGSPVRLTVRGAPYSQYVVEVSQDLINWDEAGTVPTDAVGEGIVSDEGAQLNDRRFYRLR